MRLKVCREGVEMVFEKARGEDAPCAGTLPREKQEFAFERMPGRVQMGVAERRGGMGEFLVFAAASLLVLCALGLMVW